MAWMIKAGQGKGIGLSIESNDNTGAGGWRLVSVTDHSLPRHPPGANECGEPCCKQRGKQTWQEVLAHLTA